MKIQEKKENQKREKEMLILQRKNSRLKKKNETEIRKKLKKENKVPMKPNAINCIDVTV